MKKIAVLIYSLGAGGAERVVSILLNELKDTADFTLVLMNDTIKYDIPESVPVVYLERSRVDESGIWKLIKLPFLAYRYKRLCRILGIECSMSFMNRPNYINVISKLFGNSVEVMINERAMPSEQYGYGNLLSMINRMMIRRLYPKADQIISNSFGNARDLKENFAIEKPIFPIYNPCDVRAIQRRMEEPVDFDFTRLTFVTIGRLDEGKNHKLLIEAMAGLADLETQLIIIGEGALRDLLTDQIRYLGLEKRVFLVGHQKNPYRWLAKSDCFVFASNHEGFPNVLLEALACGMAIISTDCPSGPREILAPASDISSRLYEGVEESEYGVLIPTGKLQPLLDAMVLMSSPQKREGFRKQAVKRAYAFEPRGQMEEYKKVLGLETVGR